jgi:queuine/archaeosine tRNA-ribosyltransferase
MNASFHGNARNTAMLNRKGTAEKKGQDSSEFERKIFFYCSCPVCKVRSAFITPSKHWFENKEDKHHIVKKHKNHLK